MGFPNPTRLTKNHPGFRYTAWLLSVSTEANGAGCIDWQAVCSVRDVSGIGVVQGRGGDLTSISGSQDGKLRKAFSCVYRAQRKKRNEK